MTSPSESRPPPDPDLTSSPGENDEDDPFYIDITVAHPARVYDWLLGGTDNFAVDRAAGEHISSAYPGGLEAARTDVRGNRRFLAEAVRFLAGERGIRQFLDIGTGIPNQDNVHAVAQETASDARIVYVDHDPVVLAHAHELLRSTPEGSTAYVYGDLRDPGHILAEAADTLDLAAPVAVMLVGVLHFIDDHDDPYGIVRRLLEEVPAGSYLVVSHLASDIWPDEMAEMIGRARRSTRGGGVLRSHAEVLGLFDGLDLVEPGLVPIDQWRPDIVATSAGERTVPLYGGVAYRAQDRPARSGPPH